MVDSVFCPAFSPILFELEIEELNDRIDMRSASIRPGLFTPRAASLQAEYIGHMSGELRPSFSPSCKFITTRTRFGFEVKFISHDDRRSGLHDL